MCLGFTCLAAVVLVSPPRRDVDRCVFAAADDDFLLLLLVFLAHPEEKAAAGGYDATLPSPM
jgi:hypothetical protein